MEHFLFKQLAFVRSQTLKLMEGVTEEVADQIPAGFRNTIRWNLAHIYVVLERLAFKHLELPQLLPDGFKEQFEYGTSSLNKSDSFAIPTLTEIEKLLQEQIERIHMALAHRLEEKIIPPFVTSAGMTLETPEQFLTYNVYHEGMHISVIRLYKSLLTP